MNYNENRWIQQQYSELLWLYFHEYHFVIFVNKPYPIEFQFPLHILHILLIALSLSDYISSCLCIEKEQRWSLQSYFRSTIHCVSASKFSSFFFCFLIPTYTLPTIIQSISFILTTTTTTTTTTATSAVSAATTTTFFMLPIHSVFPQPNKQSTHYYASSKSSFQPWLFYRTIPCLLQAKRKWT